MYIWRQESAEAEAATVAALDDLTDFISAAGNIFVTVCMYVLVCCNN